jgi:hypothetical protein
MEEDLSIWPWGHIQRYKLYAKLHENILAGSEIISGEYIHIYEGVSKRFLTDSITKYTLTFGIAR